MLLFVIFDKYYLVFNPFLTNVPISYPLKTPENFWFSGIFRGYQMGTLTRNELSSSFAQVLESEITTQLFRSSPLYMFLQRGVLKICSKFTGEHPYRSVISIKLQSNLGTSSWVFGMENHTSAWVFSCKFAAYFQNTFS